MISCFETNLSSYVVIQPSFSLWQINNSIIQCRTIVLVNKDTLDTKCLTRLLSLTSTSVCRVTILNRFSFGSCSWDLEAEKWSPQTITRGSQHIENTSKSSSASWCNLKTLFTDAPKKWTILLRIMLRPAGFRLHYSTACHQVITVQRSLLCKWCTI